MPDLVAYQGTGTIYIGPTVRALQNTTLVDTGSSSDSTADVFNVFDALPVTSGGLGFTPRVDGQSGDVEAPVPTGERGALAPWLQGGCPDLS